MPDIPELVVDSRCRLGEAPVWSQRSNRLYWLDIGSPTSLFSMCFPARTVSGWTFSELATGLALSSEDELIVISQSGASVFDPSADQLLRTFVSPPFSMDGIRFNDCGCDALGRLWTGAMSNEFATRTECSGSGASGSLVCIDTDLSCTVLPAGLGCPNSFVWSPDHELLYVADSTEGSLYAYGYDLGTARLSKPALFDKSPGIGIPDGSAIDGDGCLWNARWGAGCVVRYTPDGRVAELVRIPADFVTSCAFGGAGLQTLFITTARMDLPAGDLERQPNAGGVFAFKPRVPGAAPGLFHGCTAPPRGLNRASHRCR
jgi:sugar lactone lactonase YvrE